MLLRAFICFMVGSAVSRSQPPPAEVPLAGEKPAVERLDETRFRIGEVTFDSRTREIRFPAAVNMTQDLLEFLIVHKNGKVHESLLKTDISPTHLNLAFNLLRYKASPELYPEPTSPADPTARFPQVAEEVKRAARLLIEVEWQEGDRTRRVPLNEWVQHAPTGNAMPGGPWVYGGSEVIDGRYPPEATGDIAAIYLSQSAMINYPGKDNGDDTVWFVFPKRVPPVDSKVTVIISPYHP